MRLRRDFGIDIISQGVQAMVDPRIRETVAAVKEPDTPVDPWIHIKAVAKALGIDKSSALRRVRVAIEDGYLANLEERKGRPARITLGDPLPEERAVLPPPELLAEEGGPAWLSPPATQQPRNRGEGVQGANLRNKERAELEPWQQSILDEFDL